MPDAPIPLDYRTPPPKPPRDRRAYYKWLGIGAGISVIWWGLAFGLGSGPLGLIGIVFLPVGKLIGGLALMSKDGRRDAGLGLLVSIPLGALIGFGICAASMQHQRW